MTPDKANAVYDILVADCEAPEIGRNGFLAHMLSGCREYRCCHALGFGGKFYRDTMSVDYYSEDKTDERERIQAAVNAKLKAIAELWMVGGK